MARIQPVKAGDVITEGLLNRIVDQFERFANLSTNSPYIRLWDGPYGKSIALALPAQTWALLSGSSSPYSFTEVRDGPGGTWVSMTNGDSGTSNVYEVNSKSGLAGKVVPITWTSAGDWRFQYIAYAPPTFAWTFNVFGCAGTGIAGALIELKQSGVLIDSCTTGDGTGGTTLGRCILNVPGGTYDIVITGPSGAGFAVNTSSASIAATKTTNTTLAADTGYACWSCCNAPIPSALHSTDSDGPITLPLGFHPITGIPVYTLATTTAVATSCDNGPVGVGCVNCVTPSVTTKNYSIALLANCTAQLGVSWEVGACSFVDHYKTTRTGNNTNTFTPIPVTSGNCNPMNLVFTLPTTIPGTTLGVPGGGGVMAFTA